MTKRRLIEQLPAHHQTPTLKKFFGATVDQVFQPGRAEQISGYIGQVPPYFDPLKDFYKAEPTTDRQVYQLEPSMVGTINGEIDRALTYPDLLGYLKSSGAIIDNHQRLFENDFYTWSPPINPDMLLNFRQYYWFGDAEGDADLPVLPVFAPFSVYIANGTNTRFTMPPVINGYEETPGIMVNQSILEFERDGNDLVLSSAPSIGSIVLTFRYSNLKTLLENQTTFDFSLLNNIETLMTRYVGDGETTEFDLPGVLYPRPSEERPVLLVNGRAVNSFRIGNNKVGAFVAPAKDSQVVAIRHGLLRPILEGRVPPNPMPNISSGMRVLLIDINNQFSGFDTSGYDQSPFDLGEDQRGFIEGVGRSIRFVPESNMVRPIDPIYSVIDRSSIDRNPWSVRNHWVHKDTFAWSGLNFPDRQCRRPIVEFVRDIRLWNHGSKRLKRAEAILTEDFATKRIFGPDNTIIGTENVAIEDINGQIFGTIFVDNGIPLREDTRLLVAQSNTSEPLLNNRIYRVNVERVGLDNIIILTPEPDVIENGVIIEVGTALPNLWDQVSFDVDGWEVSPGYDDRWFNGTSWVSAQTYQFNNAPLFALFDGDGIALDDPGRYPGSDFTGNRIFGLAEGTGTNDPFLGVPIRRDNRGQIIFESDITTKRVTWNNTEIPGLYRFMLDTPSGSELGTNWYPSGTTQQRVISGSYEVPLNLQANPNNEEVDFVSRSEWFDHFNSIIANQTGINGVSFSVNNFRDTARNLGKGEKILQHTAPLLKTMLLASSEQFDLLAAIRYADQEYTRFKSKFLLRAEKLRADGALRDGAPADEWVVTVLSALRTEKSSDFPFAYNNIGGGQWFIPPTPSAMGLYPTSVPQILVDDTYLQDVTMIRGHDGSLTPAIGDWKDALLLALETRIYENIPTRFRVNERPDFDVTKYINNSFGPIFNQAVPNSYSREEAQRILSPIFERWAQSIGLDYRKNNSFDANDPYSWNYRGMRDRFNRELPGNWRAIYRWNYGTDRPHTHPWEMLGFASKPFWWEIEYGVAPYTSGNSKLWEDLEAGRIRRGSRTGINQEYARPGLSEMLPVDAAGNLLDPIQARIVARPPSYQQASRPWEAGDHGPIENLWVESPSYRFALMELGFLTKPARMSEIGWDTLGNGFLNDQWVYIDLNKRLSNSELEVHGEFNSNNERVSKSGIQQWLVDHLISKGQSGEILGNAVRSLDVRLAHKMAGFTTKTGLRLVADNLGIIPDEDVNIFLYNSPVTRQEVYSGVVVEWVGNGWRVIGYDARDPFFNIIPPDIYSKKGFISTSETSEPIINTWRPNTYYANSTIVSYLNSTYKCIKSHTSGLNFEQDFWITQQEDGITSSRVVTYSRGLDTVEKIPYGFVFTQKQEIADFLLGYERYLKSRGWKFDIVDQNSLYLRDWGLCVREFLSWAEIGWAEGAFIALSPGAEELQFSTDTGTIQDVEKSRGGFFGLIDRSGRPIDRRSSTVSRLDGELTLKAKDADIFAARLGISEIEHVLVFSNLTIFDDVIYRPLYNLRQPRLRLIGNRTTDWRGRRDAPGFVLVDGEIVSSFEKAADDIRYAFDIENADRVDLRDHARHLIGYQSREYLGNLLLSETQQFEFYQGLIQAKGSPGVFERLLRSQRITENRNLRFLEEWAFRLGKFGAKSGPRAAFNLKQIETRNDPQIVRLSGELTNAPIDWIQLTNNDTRWVDKPINTNIFPTSGYKAPLLPTAGYVRTNEVQHTLFRNDDLSNYYIDLANSSETLNYGDRIWVYDNNPTRSWMVYRVCDTGNLENRVLIVQTSIEDDDVVGARIFFESPHNLTTNDVGLTILIDGPTLTSPDLRGIHTIAAVNTVGNWIEINSGSEEGFDFSVTSDERPIVRILRPIRFPSVAERNSSVVDFAIGDIVYVDNSGNERWAVYKFDGTSWNIIRTQPERQDVRAIETSTIYELGTKITEGKLIPNYPLIDQINVIDPINGFIPGIAEKELSYKLDYDPARYDVESAWGEEHLGELWWNLSTVRFLETMTDILGESNERDLAEYQYRINNWLGIAPGTTVDVYEWVSSLKPPFEYTEEVFSEDRWVEKRVYNPSLDRDETVYFFWAKSEKTPKIKNRTFSANTVSRMIANPSTFDLAWISPISPDALLIGGVSTVLNDVSSVLKIDVRNNYDGVSHDEWLLLRPGDERSLPPDWLWDRIRDGLVGFNDNLQPVPNPNLHPLRRTGIIGGQSIFEPDGPDGVKTGLMAARKSFVGIVNDILSRTSTIVERPAGVQSLDLTTPIDEYLIWVQPDGSTYIEPPPQNIATFTVYSPSERDKLLGSSVMRTLLDNNTKVRVLLDNTNSSLPQWSVWEADPTVYADIVSGFSVGADETTILVNSADLIFSLAKAYDRVVNTLTIRDAIINEVSNGERIFVNGVPETGGFWTIWRKENSAYVLERVQTYRSNDFINEIDWYETGYSSSRQPVVTYNTISERNVSNNQASFVKVLNDGFGRWIWTVLENNQWVVVAREKGTISLSENFFDITRNTHVYNSYTNVSNRDGSWELRVIFDALRTGGLLTSLELNEVFFSLLHFIHSQQDEIDWCFKTSLLSVTGYDEILTQSPVLSQDNTANILSYIEEVKPYRVKTREFLRVLSTELDTMNINMSDSHLMNIKIKFDRVAGELEGLSERAANRILSYYEPREGMKEKSLDTILGLDFKGTIVDGGGMPNVDTTSSELDVLPFDRTGFDLEIEGETRDIRIDGSPSVDRDSSINPEIDDRPAYGLADPYHNPDHPEERVAISQDDHISITVRAQANPGSAQQQIRVFPANNAILPMTFEHGYIARDADSIIAYANGIRVAQNDITKDHLGAKTTFNPNGSEHVLVHSFGPGGLDPIVMRDFYTHSAGRTYPIPNGLTTANVEVVINGSQSVITIVDSEVVVPSGTPVGADVVITAYSGNQGRCRVFYELLTWNINQEWTLANMGNPVFATNPLFPQHSATIVEVDGLRLTPPPTFYGVLDTDSRWVELFFEPTDINNVQIWINGIEDTTPILEVSSLLSYDAVLLLANGTSNFALWGTKIVALNPTLNALSIIVNVYEGHDYVVNSGILAIIKPLVNGQRIEVTTFSRGNRMGIRSSVYSGNNTGVYPADIVPSLDYTWVTINGRRILPSIDYNIIGSDLIISGDNLPTDVIVVTTFNELPAREPIAWRAVTTTTATARMLPILEDGTWDANAWDLDIWDQASGQQTRLVETESPTSFDTQGWDTYDWDLLANREERPIFSMDHSWEYLRVPAKPEFILEEEFNFNSTEIVVNIWPNNRSEKVRDLSPKLQLPVDDKPGIIWISGERIEYYAIDVVNNIATISQLRRATKGTARVKIVSSGTEVLSGVDYIERPTIDMSNRHKEPVRVLALPSY